MTGTMDLFASAMFKSAKIKTINKKATELPVVFLFLELFI